MFKTILAGLGATLAILALTWAVQGNAWFMYSVFAPKYEQTRRQTFEESRAFNEGMAQEVGNAYRDYQTADDAHKGAIRALVLHRTDGYDINNLPPYLQSWVGDLRTGEAQ